MLWGVRGGMAGLRGGLLRDSANERNRMKRREGETEREREREHPCAGVGRQKKKPHRLATHCRYNECLSHFSESQLSAPA